MAKPLTPKSGCSGTCILTTGTEHLNIQAGLLLDTLRVEVQKVVCFRIPGDFWTPKMLVGLLQGETMKHVPSAVLIQMANSQVPRNTGIIYNSIPALITDQLQPHDSFLRICLAHCYLVLLEKHCCLTFPLHPSKDRREE